MSFTIVSSPDGRPDGPFVCADGSGVVIESVPGALRLTRRGQVSTMNPVDLIRDAEGRFTLSLKGAAQTCRPAVPGDLTLKIGAPQFYACADAQQVVASPFPDAVLITSFSSGQRPDQSGVLPQISPGHYQNSEWSWRQSGAVWALKFHGKAAATGCRVLQ